MLIIFLPLVNIFFKSAGVLLIDFVDDVSCLLGAVTAQAGAQGLVHITLVIAVAHRMHGRGLTFVLQDTLIILFCSEFIITSLDFSGFASISYVDHMLQGFYRGRPSEWVRKIGACAPRNGVHAGLRLTDIVLVLQQIFTSNVCYFCGI